MILQNVFKLVQKVLKISILMQFDAKKTTQKLHIFFL